MKKIALVALILLLPAFGPSAEPAALFWHTDYAAACEESAASGKPLFIFCTITGCRPCLDMEHVFRGEPEALSRCVLLRLKDETVWTPQLGVRRFPAMLVYGPDGSHLWSRQGAVPALVFRDRICAAAPAAR